MHSLPMLQACKSQVTRHVPHVKQAHHAPVDAQRLAAPYAAKSAVQDKTSQQSSLLPTINITIVTHITPNTTHRCSPGQC